MKEEKESTYSDLEIWCPFSMIFFFANDIPIDMLLKFLSYFVGPIQFVMEVRKFPLLR